MINKIYIKFLEIFINIIDISNKKKILKFLKKKFQDKKLLIIDIGAHKGETIDLFTQNFNLHKIFSFEPNLELYSNLKKTKKYQNNFIEINNFGLGEKKGTKNLNIMRETSSSTFNELNLESKYYRKKKFIVNIFSLSKDLFKKKQSTEIITLSDFVKMRNIEKIDLLKIDTEGYEYNILKGVNLTDLAHIDYIYFEHHYDLMIKKNYKFSDINNYLKSNNFVKVFKIKMKFRKTFEYIYKNTKNFN